MAMCIYWFSYISFALSIVRKLRLLKNNRFPVKASSVPTIGPTITLWIDAELEAGLIRLPRLVDIAHPHWCTGRVVHTRPHRRSRRIVDVHRCGANSFDGDRLCGGVGHEDLLHSLGDGAHSAICGQRRRDEDDDGDGQEAVIELKSFDPPIGQAPAYTRSASPIAEWFADCSGKS